MKKLPVLLKRTPRSPAVEIQRAGVSMYGHKAIVWLVTADDQQGLQIRGDARILAGEFRKLVEVMEGSHPPTPEVRQALFINKQDAMVITPTMLREKFANTPALHPHLKDVEEFIKGYFFVDQEESFERSDIERVLAKWKPESLFNSNGEPLRGAQTRVANALGITNAGSYRQRIMNVLEQLEGQFYSTTTQKAAKTAENAA